RLTGIFELLDCGAYGVAQDPGRGTGPVARSADGSLEACERHPRSAGTAEEGSEGWKRFDRADPQQPARVRVDREGVRHAHGGPEVRAREGGTLSEHLPDQPVEDGGRTLRPPAHRADWPLQQINP